MKMSIVFMGTPEFAVTVLQQLVDNEYDVRAVVTAVDKPAGRGRKPQPSEVKKYALEHNIPVLQPAKLRDEDFLRQLQTYAADVFIVVAFRMLPKEVWSMPRFGTFNLHASLLPDYRGAAPINHAIINGETITGVTTFFLDENIDTGNIIMQEKCSIAPTDNVGSMYDKLRLAGAKLVVKTLNAIANANIRTTPQNSLTINELHEAPKLSKEFCRIRFNDSVEHIHNFVRGLSPYPCAWFEIAGTNLSFKVYLTAMQLAQHNLTCGQIVSDNKTFLKIAASDGFINILELQMAGKKRMPIKDFLNGFKFDENLIATNPTLNNQ